MSFRLRTFVCLALAALAALAAACGRKDATAHAQVRDPGYPMTVTDDLGRKVAIPSRPVTIVSLAPSVTEMLSSLGEAGKLVGVTEWCVNPLAAKVERIGNMTSPDIERIIELSPSLVIGTEMTPPHVYEAIGQGGIPCVVFKHQDLGDVMADMRTIAVLLGDGEQGEAVVAAMDARRRALASSIPAGEPVRVALLYDLDSMGSAGRGSWVDDMLTESGLDNVANRAKSSWPRLSREALLTLRPRFILIPLPDAEKEAALLRARVDALGQDPVWRQVFSSTGCRILLVPQVYLNIPGPRTLEAMEYLSTQIHGTAVK
jgi:iron complex transport system substrate-binding protein